MKKPAGFSKYGLGRGQSSHFWSGTAEIVPRTIKNAALFPPMLKFETRNRWLPVSIYDIKYRESVPKCNRKVRDFAWRHR